MECSPIAVSGALSLECSLNLVPRDISGQHNTEWRGCDDLTSYVLQLQDSEKVSNNLIIKMTESDISLHATFILTENSSF